MPDTSNAVKLSWRDTQYMSTPVAGQYNWSTTVTSAFSTLHQMALGCEICLGRKTLAAGETVPSTGMELFSVASGDAYMAFVKRIILVGLDTGDTTNQSGWKFGRGGTGAFADWASNRTVNFGTASERSGVIIYSDNSFASGTTGDDLNMTLGTGIAPGESFGVISSSGVRCDSITVCGFLIPYS